MTFAARGIDGFLLVAAALCFLVAAVLAWFAPGHRAAVTLLGAGLFSWVLASLVH